MSEITSSTGAHLHFDNHGYERKFHASSLTWNCLGKWLEVSSSHRYLMGKLVEVRAHHEGVTVWLSDGDDDPLGTAFLLKPSQELRFVPEPNVIIADEHEEVRD
jgi:hypothetical protein